MGSSVDSRVFPGGRQNTWPSKDQGTGRWSLWHVVTEEVRFGVTSIVVKSGHRVIFKDCVETKKMAKALSSIVPQDISKEWALYLDECVVTGFEPLNVFPAPPLAQKRYDVTLLRNKKGIFLSDSISPVDVQHFLQCIQTESGMKVPDNWSKNFSGQDKTTSVSVTVPTRPSIESTSLWYKTLRLNLYGSSALRRVKTRVINKNIGIQAQAK